MNGNFISRSFKDQGRYRDINHLSVGNVVEPVEDIRVQEDITI